MSHWWQALLAIWVARFGHGKADASYIGGHLSSILRGERSCLSIFRYRIEIRLISTTFCHVIRLQSRHLEWPRNHKKSLFPHYLI